MILENLKLLKCYETILEKYNYNCFLWQKLKFFASIISYAPKLTLFYIKAGRTYRVCWKSMKLNGSTGF